MWKCNVLLLMWVIWLERNNRILKGKSLSEDELFEKAKYLAALWVSTDKEIKDSSSSLRILDLKAVIGCLCVFCCYLLMSSDSLRIPFPLLCTLFQNF